MTDEKLAEIAARIEGRNDAGYYWQRQAVQDREVLYAEVERSRDALRQIIKRYRDAEGTTLENHWGLPWAMADDARSALGLPIEAIHRDGQP